MIRTASATDAAQIASIYNHYVLHTSVTFEEEPVSEAAMSARITDTIASLPWLVAESDGQLLGYAHASKWKVRAAYRYAAESTIYLRTGAGGRGLGTELYRRLIEEVRARGMHTVIGGIALPNEASRRLHEKLGFRKTAHFTAVGWKFQRWIDVGYWQLIFGANA